METLRVGAALAYGWEKFKAHFLFLWMILGSVWGISFVFNLFQKGVGKETLFGTLASILAIVVGIILELGLIRMYLDLAEGTEDKLDKLFSEYRKFWRYLGAAILYGIMVALGLILFIIPGIYLALKYQFFSYLIVDKNLGVLDALKKSAVMTDGVKWKLFLFSLALCGLNILGVMALVLGLLVTIPMSIMAYVYVYRTLRDRMVSVPQVVTPVPTSSTLEQTATPVSSREGRQRAL